MKRLRLLKVILGWLRYALQCRNAAVALFRLGWSADYRDEQREAGQAWAMARALLARANQDFMGKAGMVSVFPETCPA